MSVIIRLQNLPLTASSIDIRNFFHGLAIPDGGVHIVGGSEGDAFIAFSTDEDARQAMRLTGQHLKESRVSLLLSSRNEMYKVIEQARLAAMGGPQAATLPPSSTMPPQNANAPGHLASQSQQGSSSNGHGHGHSQHQHQHHHSHFQHQHQHQHHNSNPVSNPMSPTSTGSSANDYLKSLTGNSSTSSGGSADLSSNPALLFSTMTAIPSATLGGANANPYLTHQAGQTFPGIPGATQQNQNTGLSFPSSVTNTPAPGFPSGNPFLNPPPSLSGMQLPFPAGLIPGVSSANPLGGAAHSSSGGLAGLTPTSAGLLGLSSNVMTMAGLAGNQHPINPFANPPPRMSLLSNGVGTTGSGTGSTSTLSGGNFGVHMQHQHQHQHQHQPQQQQQQRQNNSNFPQGMHNNFNTNAGGGMGGGGMGGGGGGMNRDMGNNRAHQHQHQQHQHQPQHHQQQHQHQPQHQHQHNQQQNLLGGPRAPFMLGHNVAENKSRFQPAPSAGPHGGPGGRMDMNNMGRDNNARDRRSRSRSRERKEALSRRRRSRSRDKDRNNDRGGDRRRRRSRSRSNSRSRSRDRAGISKGITNTRRDSRDKREERRRSDSSPEKNSQEKSDSERRSRRELEASPVPSSSNTTTDEWPGAKLTGVPNDASYREIKEFIRVEVMGGSDGVVRLYDDGVAFLKLENPSEFPKVYRSNGRKLRGSVVAVEGITMEIWTQEYKLNKSRIERDIDREREEREREKERDSGRPSRERDRDSRSDRHAHSSHSASSHQRSSRFSNASQSSCIAIRGLAPTITRQEVITRYLNEVACQDIVLIAAPTPTNRHSVTAFVEFESAQIAKSVADSISRQFGSTLVVEACDSEDLQRAKARTSGSSVAAPTPSGGGGGSASGPRDRDSRLPMQAVLAGMIPDTKSIFELDLGLDDETTTVILKGAPPNISERDVFDFFSDIGLAPTNVRIMYDSDGQCSGQVICEFPDNNKAKRATTKDGMLFGRGQISVSLLPNRSRISSAAAVAELALQPNTFLRDFSQQQRPRQGLLGAGPLRGAPAGMNASPRFPNPNNNSPNIFEQALQQQSGPVRPGPPPPIGGGRGRGPNGGGERMSRFNNVRSEFRGNGMGRGRGAGGIGKKDEDQAVSDDDMALFNKKGCVLGLENIPYKASMDDILVYLEDNLKIRIAPDRIIRRYDEMQKPTGDARVAFDTEFEAKLACDRLKGTYMWKRLISSAVID